MCGLAAIYCYGSSTDGINPDELNKIRDAMENRGPDAKGSWIHENNQVALAHRRLSIIDLSNRSDQPMLSEDGNYVISFNGEIYNYAEIKQNLIKKGYKFKTNSDTEVILNLYIDQGKDLCLKMRGMFAFAIWDNKNAALILGRDSYGIKPLYYFDNGNTIRIASQVKALCESDEVRKNQSPSAGGIIGFLLNGSVPEPFTIYENIKSIPAGCVVTVNHRGMQFHRYFSLSNEYQNLVNQEDIPNIHEKAKSALLDTIRAHTVADVPVGLFLSSGVDSCSLLGLMSQTGYENVHTLTMSFEEFVGTHADEAPIAEQIAKIYQSIHSSQIIDKYDFHENLPNILRDMDQPSVDGVNTWFVSREVKKRGLKVALSGLGGDELFGGYPSFKNIPLMLALGNSVGKLPGFRQFYQSSFSTLNRFRKLNDKLYKIPNYYQNVVDAYQLQRSIFFPEDLKKLLDNQFVSQGLDELNQANQLHKDLESCPSLTFAHISVLETERYMRNQLLRDSDWAGMAHSIEIRVPLVDTELLRNIGSIALKHKDFRNKRLLAESALSQEEQITLKRKKTGFVFPLQDWFKLHLKTAEDRLPILKQADCHWSKKFSLHVLNSFNQDILN